MAVALLEHKTTELWTCVSYTHHSAPLLPCLVPLLPMHSSWWVEESLHSWMTSRALLQSQCFLSWQKGMAVPRLGLESFHSLCDNLTDWGGGGRQQIERRWIFEEYHIRRSVTKPHLPHLHSLEQHHLSWSVSAYSDTEEHLYGGCLYHKVGI